MIDEKPWDDYAAPSGPWADYAEAAPAPAAQTKDRGFVDSVASGFKRSLPETKSLGYGAAAAVAGLVGADGLRDRALAGYRRVHDEEVAPLQGDSTFLGAMRGEDGQTLTEWAGDTIGNFAGQAAQSAVAGLAGAAVGSAGGPGGSVAGAAGGLLARGAVKRMVEKRVAGMAGRDAAEAALRQKAQRQLGGAAIAGTGLNVGQEVGIAYTGADEVAREEGRELTQADAVRAIAAGVPAGLLDTAAESLGVGRVLRGGTGSTFARRVAGGAVAQAGVEGGTEAAQAALERAGAGRELTGADAYTDYIENAAAGALGGGVLGGASGFRRAEAGLPRAEVPAPAPVAAPPASAEPAAPVAQPMRTTPPNSPLTRAVEVAEANGALASAAAAAVPLVPANEQVVALAKSEAIASPKHVAPEAAPARMNAATGEVAPLDEDMIRARINEFLDKGRAPDNRMLASAFGSTPERIKSIRSEVQAERRAAITARKESPNADAATPAAPASERGALESSRDGGGGAAGAAGAAATVDATVEPGGDAGALTPAEDSREVLDDDVTAPSGPFTVRGAADQAARRVGGRVVEVEGGFVVRTAPAATGSPATPARREDARVPQASQSTPQGSGTAARAPAEGGQGALALPRAPAASEPSRKSDRNIEVGEVVSSPKATSTPSQQASPGAVEPSIPDGEAAPPQPTPTGQPGAAGAEGRSSSAAPVSAPPGDRTSGAVTDLVPIKTMYGETVRVRQADLDGSRQQLRTYRKDGTPVPGLTIHRENLDHDGAQRAARAALSPNPMITRRGAKSARDEGFTTLRGARAAVAKEGYDPDEFDYPANRWGAVLPKRKAEFVAAAKEGAAAQEQATAPAALAAPAAVPARRPDPVEAAAAEAATSPKNDRPAPTERQKEVGNYAKGHYNEIPGLSVSIENPAGTKRRPEWPTLKNAYGYFKRTEGADGDHVDVFLSARAGDTELPVFVVDQVNKDGTFDEHKVMLGFADETAAREAYLSNYTKGWTGLGTITAMPMDQFKAWLRDGDTTKPLALAPGKALASEQQLFVLMGGEKYLVDDLADASAKFREYVSRADGVAENDTAQFKGAPVVELVDQDGKVQGFFNRHGDVLAGSYRDGAAHDAEPIYRSPERRDVDTVTTEKAAAPKVAKERGTPLAIDDFGETLHGARKHYAAAYADKMRLAGELNVLTEPLSKTWPQPDYSKLLEAGADPAAAAWVHAARDEIPAKPAKSWRAKGWAAQVTLLRDFAARLLSGDLAMKELQDALAKPEFALVRQGIGGRADLYRELGHDVDLRGVRFAHHSFLIYKGEKDVKKWVIDRKAKATAYSNWPTELGVGDTREEAIAAFRARLAAESKSEGEKAKPALPASFIIYGRPRQEGFFIGRKVGREAIDLKRFPTIAEARSYKSEHADELVNLWDKFKDVPPERRASNLPRVGVDHRNGSDVSPERFAETFGFRGVQFGNYVEGARRQQDLNNAYDALLDLAGVIGVPPRALSLNGSLGLAFGARGTGGVRPAAAHFEPGTVVINLTKGAGAGSLAHEWFHGLDNYFSRQRHLKHGYLSEDSTSATTSVRAEMLRAFTRIANVVQETGVRRRSQELDKRRSKAYWATGREMVARSFESYVIAKLADQNASNDYLANIVSEEAFGIENGYPYPTAAEVPAVRAAYDEFFDTLQSREGEDGAVALFSEEAAPVSFDPDARLVTRMARFIDEAAAGKVRPTDTYILGPTPDVLIRSGAPKLDLEMEGDAAMKLLTGKHSGEGITLEQAKSLPLRLADPLAVFESRHGHGALVVLTNLLKNSGGRGVVVAVHVNKRSGRSVVNRIESIHSRAIGALDSFARDGLLRYYNDEAPVLPTTGPEQFGKVVQAAQRLGKSVLRKSDLRNALFSTETADDADFSLFEEAEAEASREDGQADAARLGLDKAVASLLGPAAARVEYLRGYGGLPDYLRDGIVRRASTGRTGKPAALYDSRTGRVFLFTDVVKDPARAAWHAAHEIAGHHGLRALLGDRLNPALEAALRNPTVASLADAIAADRKMGEGKRLLAAEEALAELAAAVRTGNFDHIAARYGVEVPQGIRAKVANIVARFIERLKALLNQAGAMLKDADVRELLEAAWQAVDESVTLSDDGALLSTAAPAAPGTITLSPASKLSVKDVLKGKLTDMKPLLLGAIPMNYLSDYAHKSMPAVQQYIDQRYAMDAFRNKLHQKYDEVAQEWLRFGTTGTGPGGLLGSKINTAGQALAELMHDATIAGVDPAVDASTYEKSEEKAGIHRILRKRFFALPEDGRKLYVAARDSYTDQIKLLEDTLEANFTRAMEIRESQVEREYEAAVQEIKDSSLTEDEKIVAQGRAANRYDDALRNSKKSTAGRIIALRKAFESMRVEAPYFPLKRFGKHFVAVRTSGGELLSFSKFEGIAEAETFAKEQAAKGLNASIGLDSEKDAIRGLIDPRFVADIDDILAGKEDDLGAAFAAGESVRASDADEQSKMETIRDAIYQRYLETLPDMSLRKSFIHRKKVPGYNPDALRSYSSSMFHGSYQIARLKYGLEMGETLDVAEDQAKRVDPVEGMKLVNEMRRRHEWVMNPTGSVAGQVATTAAFVYHLAANPAHLFLNATQTAMIGVPVLGAKYGFGATGKALLRAARDFASGKGQIETVLSGEERLAMDHFIETGLIDKTQAHDLAGVGETGVEYSANRQKVMSKLSWFFHQSERFNREVTALAAYRLARRAGVGHDRALDTAAKQTWQIHFDYSSGNRPRYMQGDVAKVLFVFRNYTVNMLYRLFRDIHSAFRGETPAMRREAARQLGGMMGMYALMAGVTGVPFYGLAVMLAGAFDDEDEPFGAEERFKQGTAELLGEDVAAFLLNGVPGTVLGIDVSQRIGMPNLWFRSPDRELEGRDEYYYWMEQLLGAAPAIAKNVFTGLQQMHEGKIERGVETMLPNLVKSPMRAARYAVEDATNLDGEKLTDVSAGGVVAQLLGFTPAAVARQYEANSALKNAEAKLQKRRESLLDRYALATSQHDAEGARETMAKIIEFNAANPAFAITPDTVKRSMVTRARNEALSEGGIVLSRRLQALANQRQAARGQ